MFEAIFATNCPFRPFFLDTPAGRKSFVRIVNRVEHAATKYNRVNGFDANNPKFIWERPIEIFEEPDDYGCVAYLSFRVGAEPYAESWSVAIMQYDE